MVEWMCTRIKATLIQPVDYNGIGCKNKIIIMTRNCYTGKWGIFLIGRTEGEREERRGRNHARREKEELEINDNKNKVFYNYFYYSL